MAKKHRRGKMFENGDNLQNQKTNRRKVFKCKMRYDGGDDDDLM